MKTIITSTVRTPYGRNRVQEVRRQLVIEGAGCRLYWEITNQGFGNSPVADVEGLKRVLAQIKESYAFVPKAPNQSHEVSIIGMLPTRTATFLQLGTGQQTIDAPGKSRLASLLIGYLKGEDVPVEIIWDYIQEKVAQ